ncbi:MAG: hypothetical protein NC517_12010 [Firmicutes bacterium]|nr:hypothetical protein [Bacillota bacterium]
MRLSSSMEYLLNMTIGQLMGLVEDIIEVDEEAKRRREQIGNQSRNKGRRKK